MDLPDFPANLANLAAMGVTLSVEQRSAMAASLRTLKNNYKFKRVVFWGRLKGQARDYFVAQGYGDNLLAEKKTFISTSLTNWAQLPAVSVADAARCAKLNGRLTGDLAHRYFVVEEVMPWEPKPVRRRGSDDDEDAFWDDDHAEELYRRALALGATVTLPELYAAAGGRFAFDAETLGDAVSLIERTLGELAACLPFSCRLM